MLNARGSELIIGHMHYKYVIYAVSYPGYETGILHIIV